MNARFVDHQNYRQFFFEKLLTFTGINEVHSERHDMVQCVPIVDSIVLHINCVEGMPYNYISDTRSVDGC